MRSINSLKTFSVVDSPTTVSDIPVKSRFVFSIKYDSKGEIIRYKARLVAKGFSQIEGLNYFETTAPVAKMNSVRLFCPVLQSMS